MTHKPTEEKMMELDAIEEIEQGLWSEVFKEIGGGER